MNMLGSKAVKHGRGFLNAPGLYNISGQGRRVSWGFVILLGIIFLDHIKSLFSRWNLVWKWEFTL